MCDATCGSGTKSRVRLCDNPAPTNGGDMCTGASSETSQCDLIPCPGNHYCLLLMSTKAQVYVITKRVHRNILPDIVNWDIYASQQIVVL